MRRLLFGLAVTALLAPAASGFDYETSAKAVSYAMPVFAGGVAVYHKDWDGLLKLSVTTALTYGTAYGLKHLVRSCRPYEKPCVHGGSGWDSFPSTTTAIASAPSSFLWTRYGWEWGLPAFVISKYPSWALQKAHRNKLWDGLATTAISWGWNTLLVDRYHKPWTQVASRGFYSDLDGDSGGVYAQVGYRF